MPDLTDPEAFDRWRRAWVGGTQHERSLALQELEARSTPLASLRASMLLTTVDPAQSQRLATRALCGDETILFLMAKSQLAILSALSSWKAENPQFSVEPAVAVLEGALAEVNNSSVRNPLVLELMVRLHGILADSYTLLQNFAKAKQHAAEVAILAPAIGLLSFSASSTYQLANVAYYQGDLQEAETLFRQAAENANSSLIISERAQRSRALALADLGDDDGVLDVLDSMVLEPDTAGFWQAQSLRFLTLRYEWPHDDSGYLRHTPHTSSALVTCFRAMIEADHYPPDQPHEIRQALAKAFEALHPLLQSSIGWRKLDQQVTAAHIAYRLGEYSIAWQRLPSLSEMVHLPIAPRLRAFFVGLEVLERQLPLTASDLFRYAAAAVDELCTLEGRIAKQLAERFLLTNPVGMALIARFPGCPDLFVAAGHAATINLRTRPISVFGQEGMRPVQAVRYILEAFHCSTDLLGRLGGGQHEALKRTLYRPFHHRQCWYRPVPALQIAYALFCLIDETPDLFVKAQLRRSVQDLNRRFGFVPKLQKMDQLAELEQIERIMNVLNDGGISAAAAAALVFRKEARL
jgi:tetratricopeptide (TPR) repeat protein